MLPVTQSAFFDFCTPAVYLNKPGENKRVSFKLNKDAFAYYDDKRHAWVVDGGKYDILVGSSSRDIRQSKNITSL